jgi:tRNA/tmRNA/rRNA uracil-C5-methylase (TrmA/RlmC/RlmD family)
VIVELRVGPVAHGGHCVARHENRVVFVRHALPGELVRARVTEARRTYLRADAVEVLEPSPDRVSPPCRFAGPGRCGGCDFQHVTAAAQLRLKTAVVREQLARLGGVTDVDVEVEPLPGGPLGWRTRVQYAVDESGRVGLRRYRSHDVLPVDRCLIAAPEIQAPSVTGELWPGCRGVEVVSGDEVTVFTPGPRGGRVVAGPATVTEQAVGREWRLRPDAFWQVHPAAADTFAETVLDFLDPKPGEWAWDLYGGAGLFAAALASRLGPTGRVTLVESDPRCDPAGNLADLPQVRVVRGRVERVLGRRGLRNTNLVVLDPPRSGAGAEVVSLIAAATPRAVAYVACDPAALARDVKTFRDLGWHLAKVRAFDAFPMTHHVETIALLTPEGPSKIRTGGR